MSKLTEWAEQQEADLTQISATLDGVAEGVKRLDQLITELQNSPGAITAADQVILDRIQAASKQLVGKAEQIRVDAEDLPPKPEAS